MDGDERMSSRVVKHCSIPPPLFGAKREPTGDLVVGAPPARGTESPVFRVRETCRTVTRLRLLCGFWKRYLTSLLPTETPFGSVCRKISGKNWLCRRQNFRFVTPTPTIISCDFPQIRIPT